MIGRIFLFTIFNPFCSSCLKNFFFGETTGLFFLIVMEHRMGRGAIKNGPKIKIV